MAIPEDRKTIGTNLPFPRLNAFLDALDKNKPDHVPGSTTMFAESAACDFDFEDGRYHIEEFTEEIFSVYLVSAQPNFILTLVSELEVELSVVVNKRNYDEAKVINDRIESLKGLNG